MERHPLPPYSSGYIYIYTPGHPIYAIVSHVGYEPGGMKLQCVTWGLFYFPFIWPMCSASGEKFTAM